MHRLFMTIRSMFCLLALVLPGCGGDGGGAGDRRANDGLTDTGTTLAGAAAVVRSAVLETEGAIRGRFVAADEESTVLRGNCKPDLWANFGIQFDHPDYVWIAVTLMSEYPIQPGQTGAIPLDWIDVSFFDRQMKSRFFKGKGRFEISRHDSAAGSRRMIGVLAGSELKGSQDAEGETLDAHFAFDLNFSCGIR